MDSALPTNTNTGFVLGSVLLTWYTFMIIISLLGQYVVQSRYRSRPCPRSIQLGHAAPGVSILRPLKGLDLDLEDNLRTSFEQSYPKFEIIFSVASSDDPAIPIVERLIKEYPKVDATLILGDREVGINPKINNLIVPYERAKYDIVWILDSNVQVHQDTLGRSVDALMEPGIGLVHHLPIAICPTSYAAEVEHAFLDTNHAKMYLAINWVGVASCIVGKSNLYRRSDLERVGGLAAFGKYMAEDNIVGEALWNIGLRHRMTADTACQMIGRIRPSEYCKRRARWVRLRKYIVTAATLTEPFTESIVCGLMGALGASLLWGISMPLFFAIHWLLWLANDYALYLVLIRTASSTTTFLPPYANHKAAAAPLSAWRFIRAWVSREVLALPLYLYAMFGTEITWRNQKYRCLSDGSAVPMP